MSGFDLDELSETVRSPESPDAVRVVFDQYIDEELSLEGSLGAGTGATVGDVLRTNGILDRLDTLKAALREKTGTTPDGFTLTVHDADGNPVAESEDLSDALSQPVQAGGTITISSKVQGAALFAC